MSDQPEQNLDGGKTDEELTLVYVGPLARRLGIHYGQTFIGGLPPKVKEARLKNPAIGLLFVPVEKLAETRVKMQKGKNPFKEVINGLSAIL